MGRGGLVRGHSDSMAEPRLGLRQCDSRPRPPTAWTPRGKHAVSSWPRSSSVVSGSGTVSRGGATGLPKPGGDGLSDTSQSWCPLGTSDGDLIRKRGLCRCDEMRHGEGLPDWGAAGLGCAPDPTAVVLRKRGDRDPDRQRGKEAKERF